MICIIHDGKVRLLLLCMPGIFALWISDVPSDERMWGGNAIYSLFIIVSSWAVIYYTTNKIPVEIKLNDINSRGKDLSWLNRGLYLFLIYTIYHNAESWITLNFELVTFFLRFCYESATLCRAELWTLNIKLWTLNFELVTLWLPTSEGKI